MSDHIRVFVNEQPVEIPAGSTVRDAVGAFDAALAASLGESSGYVTDGVGRRVELDGLLVGGSILRVIGASRQVEESE
jgi:hypothetical protein